MVKQKEYLKENIDTSIASYSLTYHTVSSLVEMPYHYIHEVVYNDILYLLKKIKRNTKDNNIIEFCKQFISEDFYSFTWEYYFNLKANDEFKFESTDIINLKYGYLYFLTYLYELITNDIKLKVYSQDLRDLHISRMIREIKKSLDSEIGNYNIKCYHSRLYLKFYLKHRKEFINKW